MNRKNLTRRDLIKAFGPLAFVLLPVARSMGAAAGGAFAGAPRFVMFFKGGSYHSPSVRPASIDAIADTPLAPLMPHAQDLIVFQGMRIHDYHYSKNDSYYAYTDHESIDITIANAYQTRPALAALPFASLHIGGGAHSDADNVGLGQRYISYRKRQAGDALYGNAIEPVQNAGQVYDQLMQRVNLLCVKDSNQPATDNSALKAALLRKKSLLDLRLADIDDAKRVLGMDSEHAQKLDGLVAGWREVEKANEAELLALEGGGVGSMACPTSARPSGNGEDENNCDDLSPVHDQMIDLIKLAFAWDLTRVVAFTLSGASSGARWPSQGVSQAHHSLEHGNDGDGLNTMGRYYSEVRRTTQRAQERRRRRRPHRALQQLGHSGHGVLERQLERPLPPGHPVRAGRSGRRRFRDGSHRERRRAQQQRPPGIGTARRRHRLRRVRPGKPVPGPDRLEKLSQPPGRLPDPVCPTSAHTKW